MKTNFVTLMHREGSCPLSGPRHGIFCEGTYSVPVDPLERERANDVKILNSVVCFAFQVDVIAMNPDHPRNKSDVNRSPKYCQYERGKEKRKDGK